MFICKRKQYPMGFLRRTISCTAATLHPSVGACEGVDAVTEKELEAAGFGEGAVKAGDVGPYSCTRVTVSDIDGRAILRADIGF